MNPLELAKIAYEVFREIQNARTGADLPAWNELNKLTQGKWADAAGNVAGKTARASVKKKRRKAREIVYNAKP